MPRIATFQKILLIILLTSLCASQTGLVSADAYVWTGHGLEGGSINVLMVDPLTPSTLYEGNCGGVYKSTNAGANWTNINFGLTNPWVQALAIDPKTPTTLYVVTVDGIYKSTNAGASWIAINNGPTDIFNIMIDPKTPSTLYAESTFGLYKCMDGGKS